MTYQDKLIEFMIQKRKIIGVRQGFDDNDDPIKHDWGWYIDDDVLEAVKRWPEDRSKPIWKYIKYQIENINAHGVFEGTCPFCIKYPGCVGCEYEEKYSKCGSEGSHYQKYGFSDTKITNDQYRKIIKNIEEKANDRD